MAPIDAAFQSLSTICSELEEPEHVSGLIYINDLDHGIDLAKVYLYSDDTIIYTTAFSLNQALKQLQNAFQGLQPSLLQLKLVLNSKKTKYF